MARQFAIYALKDPRTGAIRYIGRTFRNPQTRLTDHFAEARSIKSTQRTHKDNWIQELLNIGLKPLLEILEIGNEYVDQVEMRWIAFCKDSGCKLVNRTPGGRGGIVDASPESRARMSAAAKARASRPEGKAHVSAMGRTPRQARTAEHIANNAAANRGKKRSPEAVRRITAGSQGRKRSKEARIKASETMKQKWQNQDYIDKQAEVQGRRQYGPEERARLSAMFSGKPRSPETIAKIKAAIQKRRELKEFNA